MIYLKRTKLEQSVAIPKNMKASSVNLTLVLKSNVNNITTEIPVTDDGSSSRYYNMRITTEVKLASGEYTYQLMDGASVLQSGLAIVNGSEEKVFDYYYEQNYIQYGQREN